MPWYPFFFFSSSLSSAAILLLFWRPRLLYTPRARPSRIHYLVKDDEKNGLSINVNARDDLSENKRRYGERERKKKKMTPTYIISDYYSSYIYLYTRTIILYTLMDRGPKAVRPTDRLKHMCMSVVLGRIILLVFSSVLFPSRSLEKIARGFYRWLGLRTRTYKNAVSCHEPYACPCVEAVAKDRQGRKNNKRSNTIIRTDRVILYTLREIIKAFLPIRVSVMLRWKPPVIDVGCEFYFRTNPKRTYTWRRVRT